MFVKNIMTVRTGLYSVKDTITPWLIQKRDLRKLEDEARAARNINTYLMDYTVEAPDCDISNEVEYAEGATTQRQEENTAGRWRLGQIYLYSWGQ